MKWIIALVVLTLAFASCKSKEERYGKPKPLDPCVKEILSASRVKLDSIEAEKLRKISLSARIRNRELRINTAREINIWAKESKKAIFQERDSLLAREVELSK